MLSIKAFSKTYAISHSSIYRHIRQGHLRSELLNGRRVIHPDEAELWLSEQGWRARVRNISRPDMPPVVVSGGDLWALWLIRGEGYNAKYVHARTKMDWRAERLRNFGFRIEHVRRSGRHPCYRLMDRVEILSGGETLQIGPAPDSIPKEAGPEINQCAPDPHPR